MRTRYTCALSDDAANLIQLSIDFHKPKCRRCGSPRSPGSRYCDICRCQAYTRGFERCEKPYYLSYRFCWWHRP